MNILQRIFTDYYEEIKYTLHPRSTEMENIDKMINCSDGVPASWDWRDWDYELAEKMNQYWVNFITNGDPNGEELAQWPEADENMGYIDFGAGITVHSEPLAPLEELMEEFATQYFQVPLSE